PGSDEVTEAAEAPKKLDPYALILLAQGPARTAPVQAALARLVGEGRLSFDEAEKRLSVRPLGPGRPLHPLGLAVPAAGRGEPRRVHAFGGGVPDGVGGRPASTTWALIQAVARSEAVRGVEGRLRALGWVWSSWHALVMRLDPLLPLGAVFLLGVWRIGLG